MHGVALIEHMYVEQVYPEQVFGERMYVERMFGGPTGDLPRLPEAPMYITCVGDVWFCWRGLVCGGVTWWCYVPHQGAAVPDSRSLSWSFTFSGYFSPLPVRASLVFLP